MTNYLAAYGTISMAASEAIDQVMSLKAKVKGKCFGPSRALQEEISRIYSREVTERLQLISRLIVELGTNRPQRFAIALSRLSLNLANVSEQMEQLLYLPGYRNLQKMVVAQLDHIQRSLSYFYKILIKKEEATTFNVNYLLRDIALVACPFRKGFAPVGDERLVELEITEKLDESVPHMVGDSEGIYMALYQIVDNSLVAIGTKGKVSLYTKYYDRFRQLQVTVADTGPGIDRTGILRSVLENELLDPKQAVQLRQDTSDHNNKLFDYIFEPRVSAFAYEDNRHKGIGMSLVRDEILRHRGKVEIYSKPGRGTTLQIYLNIK